MHGSAISGRLVVLAGGCLLAGLAARASTAVQSPTPSPEDRAERFRRMSERAEREGLAEPFMGITRDGKVVPGLFSIRSTGVSTEPVRKAAESFLAALTPDQRAKTVFAVDDPEWRKWMNQHFYVRQGVGFGEMTDGQREARPRRPGSSSTTPASRGSAARTRTASSTTASTARCS